MKNQCLTGLKDIKAGESAISNIDAENYELCYRGYSVKEIIKYANFEEIAYLLLYNHLPNAVELKRYHSKLIESRILPNVLKNILEKIPINTNPMDVLHIGCMFMSILEPETDFIHQQHNIIDRLLAIFPGILCYWYNFHYKRKKISEIINKFTLSEYFLSLLFNDKCDPLIYKAFDISLILYAEHEFNASTFASRVTASTLSDIYSAISTAIGTLRGVLHGGANEMAIKLLLHLKNVKNISKELKIMFSKKMKIMGFGHRVYKKYDPRSNIIKKWAYKLCKFRNNEQLFDIAETVENIMINEKKLFPNVDFYSALLYYFCNIPTFLFTPIFVMSRISGWGAHIFEQRENNNLIRPKAEYVGPKLKKFIKINERL
ncbi:citrate/2-methylcitrate synthase [Candidatus Legionella polyplacis]|uniref:Citrate synthase n=1 Tax=Candidatus Legionella polyplacis TaxID=2005262 RepID=A0ABZ2GWU7_9GAMM